MTVFHQFARRNDFETISPKMVYRKEVGEDRRYVPDDFQDEIVLGIDTSKGLVVIAGCSHAGIVNILQDISIQTGRQIYMVWEEPIWWTGTQSGSGALLKNSKNEYSENCGIPLYWRSRGRETERSVWKGFHQDNTGNVIKL